MEESGNGDYEQLYNDLRQQIMSANTARKELLTNIASEHATLMQCVCEPDPPGCGGTGRPSITFEELCVAVQAANCANRTILMTIQSKTEELMAKMCDPNPPGCIPD